MDVLKNARRAVKVFQNESVTVRSVPESLSSDMFSISKTVRHGFPWQPTVMAVDVVQNMLAVGNETGGIRFFGRAGVEHYVEHPSGSTVSYLSFLINEGALISVTDDNSVHMWNMRQKMPAIVQSLNFIEKNSGSSNSGGKISCCYTPSQSTWLYIGTEDGNVYTVVISTFTVSFYVIYWNHVMDSAMRFRPGAVRFLLENPDDNNRMLIVYEQLIAMWDLRSKSVVFRSKRDKIPTGVSWLSDGKQFAVCSQDGSVLICNGKDGGEVRVVVTPGDGDSPDSLVPASHLHWMSTKDEPLLLYSGGSSADNALRTISIHRGDDVKTLEFPSDIVGLACLPSTPYSSEVQEPHSLIVLCRDGLDAVDLTSHSMPRFATPYATSLHQSPVTCIRYEADVPPELIESLEAAGRSQKPVMQGSRRLWPLNGGALSQFMTDFSDLIITGHADGSVKFWDASQVVLTSLYSLHTADFFENNAEMPSSVNSDVFRELFKAQHSRVSSGSDVLNSSSASHNHLDHPRKQHSSSLSHGSEAENEMPLAAVQTIHFCGESGTLILSNTASIVMSCRFSNQDKDAAIQDLRVSPTTVDLMVRRSMSANLIRTREDGSEGKMPLKRLPPSETDSVDAPVSLPWLQCRRGKFRQHRGFHAALCLTCAIPGEERAPRAVEYCAAFGLMAVSTSNVVMLVDVAQQKLIISKPTAVLADAINHACTERKRSMTVVGGSPTAERSRRMPRLPTVRRGPKTSVPSVSNDGNGGGTSPVLGKKRSLGFTLRRTSNTEVAAGLTAEGGSSEDRTPSPQPHESKPKGMSLLADVRRKTSQAPLDHDGPAVVVSEDVEDGDAAAPDEPVDAESVLCMQFAVTYSLKDDYQAYPSLWLGTSTGNVISLSIAMPPTPESRLIQDVSWESKAVVLRVSSKSGIVTLAVLNDKGQLPYLPPAPYVDPRAKQKSQLASTVEKSKRSLLTSKSSFDSTAAPGHFLVAVAESNAYVYSLPSHARKKCAIREGTVVVKSTITSIGEDAVLCALTADGHSVVISLPNLTALHDIELCPAPLFSKMSATLSWSSGGQGVYLSNPSEIQRLSLLKENVLNLPDSLPDLYAVKAFPERPQKGFFANLIGGTKQLDRDALFGPELGEGNHMVATHINGNGGLEAVRLKTGEATDVFSKVLKALDERGKKLAVTEQRTAEMAASASQFAQAARALNQHYGGRS